MSTIKTDLAVLGGGPGGYVAAIRASQLGLNVAIIEKNKLGGVCLNIGCIPSKALIHQAEIYAHALESAKMGIKLDLSGFDFEKVHNKSRSAADRLSRGVASLMKKNKIQVVEGTGIITAAGKITVSGSGEETLVEAKNIIIATGSRPRLIPGFEFDGKQVLSSDDALMLKKVPESMIILGAGAIGCEFAHIMSTFGSRITMVEMLPQVLPAEDKDTSKILADSFRNRKIEIHTSTKAVSLKKGSNGVELTIEKEDGKSQTLKSEKLLVVVGRVPNTAGIGLETLGITPERGFIPVQDYYLTSVAGVYAIGDVVATPLLAHVASREGEIAVEHMAGHSGAKSVDINAVPGAVYTEPEVASFGLKTEKAVLEGFVAKEVVFPYRGAGKAVATDAADGIVKIVYAADTKEILGAHIAGSRATEILHEILLAKTSELLPEDIAAMIHAHPTLSETVMEAAKMIEGGAIHI